jgi:hypothetical protein
MSASPIPNRPAGVSPAVLVLAVLLATALTAVGMLLVRPSPQAVEAKPPASSELGNPVATAAVPVEPLAQRDVVSPKRAPFGQVYYPIPFAATPSLKLTASKRAYQIDKQDEYGFTWRADLTADDFPATENKDTVAAWLRNFTPSYMANLKDGLVFEDFTWEAKGVRGVGLPARSELTGTFNTLPNTEGEVAYELPFAQPANVELSGGNSVFVTVTEMRATGFKWKNVTEKGKEWIGTGAVTWKARGVRGPGK